MINDDVELLLIKTGMSPDLFVSVKSELIKNLSRVLYT